MKPIAPNNNISTLQILLNFYRVLTGNIGFGTIGTSDNAGIPLTYSQDNVANNIIRIGAKSSGGSSYNGATTGTVNYVPFKFNQGINPSSNATIDFPLGAVNLGSGDCSVEFWFQNSTNMPICLLGYETDNTQGVFPDFWVGSDSNGNLTFKIPGQGNYNTSFYIGDGSIHHIEVDYSSGNTYLFFDGNLLTTLANTQTFASSTKKIAIGQGIPYCFYAFTGVIDELAFWTFAKHKANFTPSTSAYANDSANLNALYHFDGDVTDSKVVTSGSAGPSWSGSNLTTAINHTLGKIPIGYLIIRKSGPVDVYDGTEKWTDKTISLQTTDATKDTHIMIF